MEKENNFERFNFMNVAMQFGTYIGVYQIIKYALLVLSLKNPSLELLTMLMAIGVPFFIYFLIRRFRKDNSENYFPFIVSWMLTLTSIFFGAMLAVMTCYLYLRFLDNGMFISLLMRALDELKEVCLTSEINDAEILLSQFDHFESMIRSTSVKDIILIMLSINLTWGNIFSLVIAALTAKNKRH